MPLYYFLIRAENVLMDMDGVRGTYGFFTGRTVEAADEDAAVAELWKAVDTDKRINSVARNHPLHDMPVMFYIEDCREVSSPETMGMAFYPNAP